MKNVHHRAQVDMFENLVLYNQLRYLVYSNKRLKKQKNPNNNWTIDQCIKIVIDSFPVIRLTD